MQRVVLTGGPGAGKSSLLEALRSQGYCTVSETARELIASRRRQGLTPRPSPREFAREILRQDILKYQCLGTDGGLVFFDRGVVDALGMIDEAERLQETQRNGLLAAYAYHPQVFVLPPWEAIYVADAERDQSFAEAVAVHRSVTRWYRLCDYELVEVPRLSVADRCEYVLRELGRKGT